jgi:hypothetical protein
MKRRMIISLLVTLGLALLLAGCGGKGSSLEGKVVDGSGKPIAGLKIIARQVQLIKGYEQFEAVSGPDGAFKLKGLYPQARYTVSAEAKTWTTEAAKEVDTAADGETRLLSNPFVIRTAISRDKGIEVRPATGEPLSSTLQGKVVDASGNPLANITIIATCRDAKEGYREFKAVSAPDGKFVVTGLYPGDTYTFAASTQTWITKGGWLTVRAGTDGEVRTINKPLEVKMAFARDSGSLVMDLATGKTRYTVSPEGVIADNTSGLEWVFDPDTGTDYNKAVAWVAGCNIAGGGWRMPTRAELKGLYAKDIGPRNMDPVFKTTGWWVWAEPRDSSSAWRIYFNDCGEGWGSRGNYDGSGRVFAVRTAKK